MKKLFCKKSHKVFMSSSQKCCGEVEEFLPQTHVDRLIGNSNSWIAVWTKWKDNSMLEQISKELADTGCYSAATIINEFILKLISAQETETTKKIMRSTLKILAAIRNDALIR